MIHAKRAFLGAARLCLQMGCARICLHACIFLLCLVIAATCAGAMAGDVISALLRTSSARSYVASLLGDAQNSSENQETARTAVETEQRLLMTTPTPYGSVLQEVRVPRNDGSQFPMLLCRPKALLWLLVRMSAAFEAFCVQLYRRAHLESQCIWTTCGQATNTDLTTCGPTTHGP